MNTKSLVSRTVIVFAALSIAGIVTAASSQLVTGHLERTITVALGSSMFGAALCFFLIRLFSILEK